MLKLARRTYVYIAGAAAATSLAGAMLVPEGATALRARGADLLQVLQSRSPGDRASGAVTNKAPRQIAYAAPISRVLPVAEDAPEPDVVPLASAAAPVIAAAPIVAGPAAAPLVAAPIAAAPIAAALPAAAAGLPAAAGLLPLIPAIPIIAGGGGGGPPGVNTPPVTGGGTPTPGPAVPEPATWLMMMTGFGILGAALRRRKQVLRVQKVRGEAAPRA